MGNQAAILQVLNAPVVVVISVLALVLIAGATYLYWLFCRTGEFLEANGVRLHYVQAGQGPPVVLVHGLAFNHAAEWMLPRVFQRLSKRYRVIALDNRGHGKSDKLYDPSQYGLELVDDVVRLMDHLGIEKAHVVGYSLGGFITLRLALRHPGRLLSAAPCGAGWTANPAEELKLLYGLSDDLEQGRGITALLKWLQVPGKPLPTVVLWFANHVTCAFNDVRALSCLLRNAPALVPTERDVRSNVVPCLAIVGANDHMRVFAEQMAGVMPNLELVVIPGCDHHSTPVNRQTVPTLMAFLDRHTP
jgi:pimeloyl-ACP methyl ester carboxylesterase